MTKFPISAVIRDLVNKTVIVPDNAWDRLVEQWNELEAENAELRKAAQEAVEAHKGDDKKAFNLAMISLEIASITDEERLRRAEEAWDKMHPPKGQREVKDDY